MSDDPDQAGRVNVSPAPPMSSPGAGQPADELLRSGTIQSPDAPGALGRIGRFRIIKVLGSGGMGQVLLAHEPITHTRVAIKVLHPGLAQDPGIVHRFLVEARHMYRMSHPGVVRVTEVSDRKEGPYYVMPYLDGGSLVKRIDPAGPMPRDQVLRTAKQVAEALLYAHEKGIIHRDLKPGNVLLDRDGNAFLTDFGLLRTVFNDSMVDVRDGQLEGTAPYMSPATAAGKAEDTRCDIYAFGALLYEMLASRPPYTGATPQAILSQITAGPPTSILKLSPKAPLSLVRIADWAMARELRNRYATMADVVSDLNRVAKNKSPLGPHQRRRWYGITAVAVGVSTLAVVMGFVLARWVSEMGGTPSNVSNRSVATYSRLGGTPRPTQRSVSSLGRARPPAEPQSFRQTADEGTPPAGSAGAAMSGTAQQVRGDVVVMSPQDQYLYATNGNAITLVKYAGPGGDVMIPDTINGLPVVAIANNAFQRHTNLTSVTIPDSVTSIGSGAFSGCAMLRDVTIPNSVILIGHMAFSSCASLTSVTLPSNVTRINPMLFNGCSKLTAIRVGPENLAFSSEDGVLFNKDRTCLIVCPGGKVGRYAIPDGVVSIGPSAFQCGPLLTGIVIPPSVESISPSAFSGGLGLVPFTVDAANTHYSSSADGILFDKEKTTLVRCPVRKDGVYTVPNGVTSIEDSAFADCRSLTKVTLPPSVATVGASAFRGCQGLTRVCFEGHAPTLGSSSFMGADRVIVYHRSGATGWGNAFGGRPTAIWESDAGDSATQGGQVR